MVTFDGIMSLMAILYWTLVEVKDAVTEWRWQIIALYSKIMT